jgi:methylphosphotriester-DNA--protein-cysteine methyltransferase
LDIGLKDAVGISPKLFGRMQRFQRVFWAVEGTTSDWIDVAVHCGYYDRAHLIRDFREFAGKTPTALLDQEIDLSRHFVQALAMSHFSKTAFGGSR